MAVLKEQWQDWLEHPVTQALHEEIKDSASDAISRLLSLNREGGISDEALKGMVNGLYLIANWTPDFVKPDEEGEVDDE